MEFFRKKDRAMPVLSLTLEEVNKTIINESVYSVVKDMVEFTKMAKNAIIVYNDDYDVAKTNLQDNANNENENRPTTASTRRLNIAVSHDYNVDDLTSSQINQEEHYPIFEDKVSDVTIWLNYFKTDFTIEITYITPSRTEAIRWRDDVRAKLARMRDIYIHDIEYNIILPSTVEDFIADVYENVNRLNPMTLDTYFRQYSSKRLKLLTDLVGNNTRIGIAEKQSRIVGMFDFSTYPDKIEKDKDTNTYSITFTYKLTMDVPGVIVMRYPFMVYNKLINPLYLSHITRLDNFNIEEYRRDLNVSKSMLGLTMFESHRELQNHINTNLPLTIPYFDDFSIRKIHDGYAITTTFLTQIDETDRRTLLNLKDLGEYYLDEDILAYIASGEKNYCINPYMSYIYFGIYQDNKYFNNNILTIDSNLNLKSTIDLDLTKQTRVLLNFVYDINYVKFAPTQRALLNTAVYVKFISEYINVLVNYPDLSKSNNLFDLYHYIVKNLYEFYVKNDYATVGLILNNILVINKNLHYNFLVMMKNNFPELLQKFINANIIEASAIPNETYFAKYYSDINLGMRTVQTFFIGAYKKEPTVV